MRWPWKRKPVTVTPEVLESYREGEVRAASSHEEAKETWQRTIDALAGLELLRAQIRLAERGRGG